MSSLNRVQIIGRLGQDPDNRYLQSGTAVANLSVATSEQWKDKNSGEKQERTEWHKVTLFGRLAEVVGQYLGKGSLAYFEGRIQTDKWQDKEGNDRYTTKIIADRMVMLDSRGKSGNQDTGPSPADENQDPGPDPDMPF